MPNPVLAQTDVNSTESAPEEETVDLAFRTVNVEDGQGFYSKVDVAQIDDYDHVVYASDILTGRASAIGLRGSNNIRGIGIGIDMSSVTGTGARSGNALTIVDGLPRDIDNLRVSEIESITVLKDANACVLYGSAAMNGVILITTKRGKEAKNYTKVSANYGIQTPKEMPEWLNSADYMTWYNQARVNDGLSETYSAEDIEHYRNGNKYRYPDVDYYSRDYLKPYRDYFDVNAEFSGGGKNAHYYINAGWYSLGSQMDFGGFKGARDNRLNIRTNSDLRINDWITTSNDATAIFVNSKSGRGNYWSLAGSTKPYLFSPLLPIDLVDPEDPVLATVKNTVDGKYIFGGSSTYTYTANAFALGYEGGTSETINRKYTFNNRVNFDLGNLTEGLSFHTNMSFDFTNMYTQSIYNTLAVYQPTWSADSDTITKLTEVGTDSRPGTQSVSSPYFRRRMGFYALLKYDRTFRDLHHVYGNLVAYSAQYRFRSTSTSETSYNEDEVQGTKQAHIGLNLGYAFDKKYMVDFSGVYLNATKLAEGHRRGFSPTVSFGWVMSNEDFMDNVSFVDFLKLKLTAGIVKSDISIPNHYLYEDLYTTSGSSSWNEGNNSNTGRTASRGANVNLGFESRNEVNFGFESRLFGHLSVEANVFLDKYKGQVVRTSSNWPNFYSAYVPYENYEVDSYKGFEGGVRYENSWGDFRLSAGGNILLVSSNRDVVSELYENDYQYRQGKPRDASFALEALGLFQSQAEIDSSPTQTFGTVRPGDIKYKDQNGDGVIDTNDQVFVARSTPPVVGALELNLAYRNLELYVRGYGYGGSNYCSYTSSDYYWLNGTDKYSVLAKDTWTPSNPNAKYPALTTTDAANNNRNSTFWMYNNSFFQISKIQLTYKVPSSFTRHAFMQELKLFVNASSPFQIAENRVIRERNSPTSAPQYRTFSIGLNASF
ncbi:MAG: SusC/RagA family TonB-linked outer membrane protein [Bacteroidales bacterium]|nr:SusC/RagA family TonB-linked outer membrane protein [Bacteroidales bacterium]